MVGQDKEAWDLLASLYPAVHDRPLRACFNVARSNGAHTVVVETRYIDRDFRSEYSAFYSKAFVSMADTAHRLHFFKAVLKPSQLTALPADAGYLGYMIVRPSPVAPVGRTMLAPPHKLQKFVRTAVEEVVHLFGQRLTVRAVPYAQQDTQVGRCAHAAAWMAHYSAYRRGEAARRSMADFGMSTPVALGWRRPLPSSGLTDQQTLELLRVFDLPAAYYSLTQPAPTDVPDWMKPDPRPPKDLDNPDKRRGRWDHKIRRACCRYLNSELPVIANNTSHSFLLCGYVREAQKGRPDRVSFIRHDDQRGPYGVVEDIFNDVLENGPDPWQSLIVPLPEKLWLPPEAAEMTGSDCMLAFAEYASPSHPTAAALSDMKGNRLALRTYATTANRFKAMLAGRLPAELVTEYQPARFSRYIWVVEAIDADLRNAGDPNCVVGEAVLDSTSSEHEPNVLAVHVPGVAMVSTGTGTRYPLTCSTDPYPSGGAGPC